MLFKKKLAIHSALLLGAAVLMISTTVRAGVSAFVVPAASESRPTFVSAPTTTTTQLWMGGEVTPKTIKQLRDATGAGMMDCKAALLEVDGDQEAAADYLRKKGLAKADKKASRVAAEGKVAVQGESNKEIGRAHRLNSSH